MYRSVSINDGDGPSGRKLRALLLEDPARRQLVERIDFGGDDINARWLHRFLKQEATLPSLTDVGWLHWDSFILSPKLRPVAGQERPQLLSLRIGMADQPGTGHVSPSALFDLSRLRRLHLAISSEEDCCGAVELLQEVPDDLEHLKIAVSLWAKLPVILTAATRLRRLSSLSLSSIYSDAPAPSDLLAPFPDLCLLSLSHDDILPPLSTPHRSLAHLIIGNAPFDDQEPEDEPDEEGDYSDTLPLVRKVGDLCRLLSEHPTRFPSLRSVQVRPGTRRCSFITQASRSRDLTHLEKMSGMLREVGLKLVDEEGWDWKEEWDGES